VKGRAFRAEVWSNEDVAQTSGSPTKCYHQGVHEVGSPRYARNEGKGASAVTCFIIFLLSCHAFWGRNLWGPGDMEIRGVKRMVAHTADLSQPKTSMEVVEVD